jgi:hypothetical protein
MRVPREWLDLQDARLGQRRAGSVA